MDAAQISAAIRRELEERGLSAYRAAIDAGLPENAIRTVLAGHEPKVGRLAQICDALGLEFYVGPSRGDVPPPNDAQASRPPERTVAGRLPVPVDVARSIQRSAWEMVRLAVGAGRNPIPDDLWPIIASQWGEAPPIGNENIPAGSGPVEVIQLEAAAGGSGEPMRNGFKGRVWFRRGWLERRGLKAEDCMVIGVKGDSMEPTLPGGCSILVDRASTDWEPPHVLVVRTDEGLVIKRAARGEDGAAIMQSDHPDWPDAPLPAGAEIVGRVRWMACGLE